MAKSRAEQIAATLETPTPRLPAIPDGDMLSTGCTVLNMAFSGRPNVGVPKGTYWYIVGDSGSSKTWFTFCLFAEAARNSNFDKYRFVHDNAENGALMDVEKFFGKGVLERCQPPSKHGPASTSAKEFYLNVETNVDRGPCIYVLDSMDAIPDLADEAVHAAEMKQYQTGEGKVPGSMGMSKAKTNSGNINRIANTVLRQNGSILVVISQTRDKVGSHIPGLKTRAGGHALKFFAHLELWTKIKKPITKHYHGKDREIGAWIEGDVQKNRVCGWHGKVPLITFLAGYGISDVDCSVDYLLDEKHWKAAPKDKDESASKRARPNVEEDEEAGAPKQFYAPEFSYTGAKEGLVKQIQLDGTEARLAEIVASVWRDIAAGAAPVRKPRYS